MLIINIWEMNIEMLILGILGMLGSFDRCDVRGECGNGGMLWLNVLIGAMLGVNVLIGEMLGLNVEIGKC